MLPVLGIAPIDAITCTAPDQRIGNGELIGGPRCGGIHRRGLAGVGIGIHLRGSECVGPRYVDIRTRFGRESADAVDDIDGNCATEHGVVAAGNCVQRQIDRAVCVSVDGVILIFDGHRHWNRRVQFRIARFGGEDQVVASDFEFRAAGGSGTVLRTAGHERVVA